MRVLVVIPSRDVAATIAGVVAGIREAEPGADILVVNDGSTDATTEVARDAGAVVIEHDRNRGKGAALRTGFRYAVENRFDAVVTMDGDGQHDPNDIPRFVEALGREGVDIVVGSRMHAVGDMPGIRIWTNRTTSNVVSSLAGQDIPDSQSGYRILSAAVLRDIVDSLVTTRYDTESEILIRAGRRGYGIDSIEIEAIYNDGVSYINPFVDTLRFLRLVAMSLFWR